MDKRVYESVSERAEGHCECGCGADVLALEADHYFGRARAPENPANVWMLRPSCHRQKTDGVPSAVVWAIRFAKHCIKHGYRAEALRALDNGEFKAVRSSIGTQP